MFQSLTASPALGVVAEALSDSDDVSDAVLTFAVVVLFIVLGLSLMHFALGPRVSRKRIRKMPQPGPLQSPQRSEPSPASSRRRLIALYEVTPGHAPTEYNLGDGTGGRGSVAARNR